jgi:hypothetical protein
MVARWRHIMGRNDIAKPIMAPVSASDMHRGWYTAGTLLNRRSVPPAFTLVSPLRAREGADGQAVVCPLLRGSSPTRAVAPKQHRGLRRAFSPAFRTGSLDPFGAWAPKNLAQRTMVFHNLWKMVSAGAMLLDRLGPPGRAAAGCTMERSPAEF